MSYPDIPSVENNITIAEQDVYYLLSNIKCHKATNSEDYPSWISKNNAHIIGEPLTDIINSMLKSGSFPACWKKAEVVPINKVKNPKQFKDLRPISLLFHLGKIAERIVTNLIQAELPPLANQFAYSQTLSTTDALVKLASDVAVQLDNKGTVAVQALLLDFSKAFDRMHPVLAVHKLLNLGVKPSLVRIVKCFLTQRHQCVKYQGQCSSYKPSYIGVPQGTIMGPILWNIFISNLTPNIDHIKYADDTTIYNTITSDDVTISDSTAHKATITFHENHLQTAAEYASLWCKENHMLLNTAKSSTITFTLQKVITSDPICIEGNDIEELNSTKLLGVTFDEHLRFSIHVDTVIEKSRPAFHAMIKLKKCGVKPVSLGIFYQTRILPIITYAAPSWYPFISNNDKEKLEKHQKLSLHTILPFIDSYEEQLTFLKIEAINIHLDIICLRYIDKLQSHCDHPLYKYTQLNHSKPSNRRRPKQPTTSKCRTALLAKSLFFKYR